MKKNICLRSLCMSAWIAGICALLPNAAQAQDGIFVPADVPQAQEQQQPQQQSALAKWVSLDAGLYDVVLQYDDTVRIGERAERRFEPAFLRDYEDKMRHPDRDYNVYTPSEWGYYNTLIHEPTACNQLDKALAQYIAKNSSQLSHTITQLINETKDYSEEQKIQTAAKLQTAFAAAAPNKKRAQEILYFCLHRFKNEIGVQKPYSIEKTLRNWFNIEAKLLDVWLGPVD